MPRTPITDPIALRRQDLEETKARLALHARELRAQVRVHDHHRRRSPYYYAQIRPTAERRRADLERVLATIKRCDELLAALPGSAT